MEKPAHGGYTFLLPHLQLQNWKKNDRPMKIQVQNLNLVLATLSTFSSSGLLRCLEKLFEDKMTETWICCCLYTIQPTFLLLQPTLAAGYKHVKLKIVRNYNLDPKKS